MIEHIVLLKPKADVATGAVEELWRRLHDLKHLIPGITSVVTGENVSIEDLNQGYTLGFVVTFELPADRDRYLPHPDHLAVVPFVHAVADRVLVFDLERGDKS